MIYNTLNNNSMYPKYQKTKWDDFEMNLDYLMPKEYENMVYDLYEL